MRSYTVLILLVFYSFIFVSDTKAKLLPQAGKVGKSQTVKKVIGVGITVSPRFRTDRRAVIVNFGNLQNVSNVSYTLTYTQNGQEEGAIGTLNLGSSQTASQELLFGTCSKNVCRYHTNITNAKLEVLYTTKAGKKFVKRYRLKI